MIGGPLNRDTCKKQCFDIQAGMEVTVAVSAVVTGEVELLVPYNRGHRIVQHTGVEVAMRQLPPPRKKASMFINGQWIEPSMLNDLSTAPLGAGRGLIGMQGLMGLWCNYSGFIVV